MTPQPPFLLLKAVDAFRELDNDDLRKLYAAAHVRSLASGEKLVEAGTPVTCLDILMSGRLIATGEDAWASEEQPVKAVFSPGTPIDPSAFFRFGNYPWTVIAARPSAVLRLAREDLREAVTETPAIWEALLAGMAGSTEPRVQSAVPTAARVIALCPAASGEVPKDFLRAFSEALEALGACQILSSAGLGQDMPGGIALDDPRVIHDLEESERINDVVVYVADGSLTPWTRRCIDRADEVLIVGVDDGNPTGATIPTTEVERCALAMAGSRTSRLAIVSGRLAGRLQAKAERWLSARPVEAHHFVALGDHESFARLARFVMRRANAVTLAGSGLCGAAHLGVITALQAAGVRIDAIGGTGAGAAVGALLACGLKADGIDSLAREIFADNEVFKGARRQTFLGGGRLGLYGHAFYDRLIDLQVPHGTASDLRLPFCGLAMNISRSRSWDHARDSLAAIVRTNWTPPGVFAPFITAEGDMLVDASGAIPPPVQQLRMLGIERCFGVHPLPGPLGRSPAAYRDLGRVMRSGIFARKGSAPHTALPTVPDITIRTQNPRWFAGDDVPENVLVFQPPMPRGVSLLDFARHSQIMALAHDWALREIAQLHAEGDPAFASLPNDVEALLAADHDQV